LDRRLQSDLGRSSGKFPHIAWPVSRSLTDKVNVDRASQPRHDALREPCQRSVTLKKLQRLCNELAVHVCADASHEKSSPRGLITTGCRAFWPRAPTARNQAGEPPSTAPGSTTPAENQWLRAYPWIFPMPDGTVPTSALFAREWFPGVHT